MRKPQTLFCAILLVGIAGSAAAGPIYSLTVTPNQIQPGGTAEIAFDLSPEFGATLGSGSLELASGDGQFLPIGIRPSPAEESFIVDFSWPDAGVFQVTISGSVIEISNSPTFCDTNFCFTGGPGQGFPTYQYVERSISASAPIFVGQGVPLDAPEPNLGWIVGAAAAICGAARKFR